MFEISLSVIIQIQFETKINFLFGQLYEDAGIADKTLQIDIIWCDSVVNDLVEGTTII